MPTYTFIHKETGEITEHVMKIAELDEFKKNNPVLERYMCDAPSIGDPIRLGIRKNDNGWRETLQRVAEKTPGGKGLRDNIR
jgi:hypothetical protein